MQRPPEKGLYYRHKDEIFKVKQVSQGTDEVLLESLKDKKEYTTRYATFSFSYTEVFKIGMVASILGRATKSIRRYERRGQIKKPTLYHLGPKRVLRFYTPEDILEIHELISGIHAGRPRKDKRVVNNITVDRGTLKQEMRKRLGYGYRKK